MYVFLDPCNVESEWRGNTRSNTSLMAATGAGLVAFSLQFQNSIHRCMALLIS